MTADVSIRTGAHALFAQRGMSSLGAALEHYFAPASKLRARACVRRVLYVLRAASRPARNRDERVFSASGTWVPRTLPAR